MECVFFMVVKPHLVLFGCFCGLCRLLRSHWMQIFVFRIFFFWVLTLGERVKNEKSYSSITVFCFWFGKQNNKLQKYWLEFVVVKLSSIPVVVNTTTIVRVWCINSIQWETHVFFSGNGRGDKVTAMLHTNTPTHKQQLMYTLTNWLCKQLNFPGRSIAIFFWHANAK